MPSFLDQLRSRIQHASSGGIFGGGGGGLLGGTGGSGILSAQAGILKSRIATLKAGGTIQSKIQGLAGTLGTRLNQPGGLLAGIGSGNPAPPPPSTDFRYAAGAQTELSLLPPPSSGRFT